MCDLTDQPNTQLNTRMQEWSNGRSLTEYSIVECTDQPDTQLNTRIQEWSEWPEWPKLDWIFNCWVYRSAWHAIEYWNPGIIGMAEAWVNTQCVIWQISLTRNWILECRNNRNGWSWLNIQLLSVQISLTSNWILESRNDRNGRSLTEYSIVECTDQPDTQLNTRMQEWSEWPKLDWIFNCWVYRSAWHAIEY